MVLACGLPKFSRYELACIGFANPGMKGQEERASRVDLVSGPQETAKPEVNGQPKEGDRTHTLRCEVPESGSGKGGHGFGFGSFIRGSVTGRHGLR